MAFKLSLSNSYTEPVEIVVPQVGGLKKLKLQAQFKRLKSTEFDELLNRINHREITDQNILEENLTGWSEFCDDDGQPIEFSPENLAYLCEEVPQAAPVLTRKFLSSVTGVREKN